MPETERKIIEVPEIPVAPEEELLKQKPEQSGEIPPEEAKKEAPREFPSAEVEQTAETVKSEVTELAITSPEDKIAELIKSENYGDELDKELTRLADTLTQQDKNPGAIKKEVIKMAQEISKKVDGGSSSTEAFILQELERKVASEMAKGPHF